MHCFVTFFQSFEHHIADLNWCLGNAYRLVNDFNKPADYFTTALKLYQSQEDALICQSQKKALILKQIKVHIELGKTYR